MVHRDTAAVSIGIGAIVVTLGIGTCSTNRRIDDMHRRMDDGFANMDRRMDDGFANMNRRMDDGFGNVQRQIDNLQTDVRELRTLYFESRKNEPPAN